MYGNHVKKQYLIFFISCLFFAQAQGGGFIDAARTLFTDDSDERDQQLEHLKKDYESLQKSTSEALLSIKDVLDQTNRDIAESKEQEKTAQPQQKDFIAKKQSLLNEVYQTAFDIQFLRKEMLSTLEQHLKLLEEYKKDPLFKSLALEPKSFYSYEQVQGLIKKVFDQENKVKLLRTQKEDATVELENRKKKKAIAIKEYQDKKREQKDFGSKPFEEQASGDLTFQQQGQLLDLEEKHLSLEQELAELRVIAATRKLASINSTIFVEQEKLKILKNNLNRAKAGLRITAADIQEAREALEKNKQESLAIKGKQNEELKRLTATKEQFRKDLEALMTRYENIAPEAEEAAAWIIETPTIDGYTALCDVGHKHAQIELINRRIEYLRTQNDLVDAKISREEMAFAILNTWYDITQGKFKDTEDVLLAEKKFRERQSEAKRDKNSATDKQATITNSLNLQNKELSSLREFIDTVRKEKDTTFTKYPTRYTACLVRLNEAEKLISDRMEISSKLIEVHSQLIATLNSTIKQANVILTELETKSIWQRSEYAISWQGLKSIIPDIMYFIADVKQIGTAYLSGLTWKRLTTELGKLFRYPVRLLFIFFLIACIIGLYFFLCSWLPKARRQLASLELKNKISSVLTHLSACILGFIHDHLFALFLWLIAYGLLRFDVVHDLFPRIVFNLVSIPYMMYLARSFINYLIEYNKENGYPIFAEFFEKRFHLVFSIFAYLTIGVFFFREAFMLATVHKSELPTILLAGYSIILRTLVIFSIGKEEILSLITGRGPVWTWLASIIEQYYYLLLVSIILLMIMSDPYIGGFGNLVSYIMWGVLATLVLMRILFYIHTVLKKQGEVIFFSTDDDVKRERFTYAKTWYGFFVIALFLLFVAIGVGITTRIWGIPITMDDIYNLLHYHLFSTGVDKVTNEPIWVTPLKLLSVVAFIVAGFLSAVAFNRFVLQRIFDILPIDVGVQNTVSSFTRYFIILIFIYVGFLWAGLGNLLLAIVIALGSIAYIVKEPIGDFISYFIILVQRPVQIGDYIMIDEATQGVVRKITPRSIVLRRKDSYTIIVPNSMLLSRPLNNWNYARNFVAFDDMMFSISYDSDPIKVKKVIENVLDESLDILKSPRPIIRLNEFGEYGYVFLIRGFLSNINMLRKWDIASDLRFKIVKALDENGIKLAVPTRLILNSKNGQSS